MKTRALGGLFVTLLFPCVSGATSGADIPNYLVNEWAAPVGYQKHEDCWQLKDYEGHTGDDFCRNPGISVLAISDGCVESYKPDAGYYGGVNGELGRKGIGVSTR